MRISTFLAGTSLMMVMAVTFSVSPVYAATVKEQVTVTQKDIPDMNKVNYTHFDTNKDGILTRKEVGERIFRSFDMDGNMSIDSMEFGKKSVLTIVPVEKETTISFDVNDDGKTELSTYTVDNFLSETGLTRFSKGNPSISAKDFIGTDFKKVDTGKNGYIELNEWTEVYDAKYANKHDNPQLYNN